MTRDSWDAAAHTLAESGLITALTASGSLSRTAAGTPSLIAGLLGAAASPSPSGVASHARPATAHSSAVRAASHAGPVPLRGPVAILPASRPADGSNELVVAAVKPAGLSAARPHTATSAAASGHAHAQAHTHVHASAASGQASSAPVSAHGVVGSPAGKHGHVRAGLRPDPDPAGLHVPPAPVVLPTVTNDSHHGGAIRHHPIAHESTHVAAALHVPISADSPLLAVFKQPAHRALIHHNFKAYKRRHSVVSASFDDTALQNQLMDASEVTEFLRDMHVMPRLISADAVKTLFRVCAASNQSRPAGSDSHVDMEKLADASEFTLLLCRVALTVYGATDLSPAERVDAFLSILHAAHEERAADHAAPSHGGPLSPQFRPRSAHSQPTGASAIALVFSTAGQAAADGVPDALRRPLPFTATA